MKDSVPVTLDCVQGAWQRDYLKNPGGIDTSTWVHWMQSEDRHVDLRLSVAFRALPLKPLCEQTPAALLEIANVVAFAGTTHLENSVCTWTRQINYQGPESEPDIALLSWQDESLIEQGAHQNYEEAWRRYRSGHEQAVSLSGENGQMMVLCIVRDHFAMARAHPDNLSAADSLSDRVQHALQTGDNDALSALFDQEFCFGMIDRGDAVITESSIPSQVGSRLLSLHGPLSRLDEIEVAQQDFLGCTTWHSYRVDR